MSDKLITLPTEIADKWLEALRSGNYKQGQERLVCEIPELGDNEITLENASFCCLGVAGAVCGIPLNEMYDVPLFEGHTNFENVPEDLRNNDKVIIFLSQLNDKRYSLLLGSHLEDGWIIREEILKVLEEDERGLTFLEIADIIEDNVNKI